MTQAEDGPLGRAASACRRCPRTGVFIGLFVMPGLGGGLFPLTGLSPLVMIALDLIRQRSAGRRRPGAGA